ncbi:MAG: hypothetical protein ACO4CT_13570 [Planctomycetota bacterium]
MESQSHLLLPIGWIVAYALQVAIGIGVVWLFTRTRRMRQALQTTTGAPGLLVPVVVSSLILAVLWSEPAFRTENPFRNLGTRAFQGGLESILAPWLVLIVVAAALAGHVGLLAALRAGHKPTGTALVRGVRSHFLAIFLARAGIALCAAFLFHGADFAPVALPLLLVPSAVLAPVFGSSAAHPGRPDRALARAVSTGLRHLFRHGGLALLEIQAVVVLAWLASEIGSVAQHVDGSQPIDGRFGVSIQSPFDFGARVLVEGGTVSYDQIPIMGMWVGGMLFALPTVLCGLFLQSVFVTAQFQAHQDPVAPASRPRS